MCCHEIYNLLAQKALNLMITETNIKLQLRKV